MGDSNSTITKQYSEKYTNLYHELQIAQERPKAVRDLLAKFRNEKLLERFDNTSKVYYAVKSGTSTHTAAATEMRALLDGLQGELFERARKQPKENMIWDEMVMRISKGEAGSVERQELIRQNEIRSSLVSQLSDVLKYRKKHSIVTIEMLWTQVIDHIYVVMGLIKLPEISEKTERNTASI